MLQQLYFYFRGVIGFTLIIVGMAFFFEPKKDRVRLAFGTLFICVGGLFTLSALDPLLGLSDEFGNFLVLGFILALSQALLVILLDLLGDESFQRHTRSLFVAGLIWSLALWALPFLDYLFKLGPVTADVEDGHALGPIHAFTQVAMYLWPIIVSLVTALARWIKPLGRPRSRELHLLGIFTAVVAGLLVLIVASAALSAETLYRIGHTALELAMLAWFYTLEANPDCFAKMREEIRVERERILTLGDAEASIIATRLDKLVADGTLIYDPGLSLARLAHRIDLPPYRLSCFFNQKLGTTFPVWLNAQRIERVRRRLLGEPERTILEIALDCGYSSKAVFNEQFKRIIGTSPSEYRKAADGNAEAVLASSGNGGSRRTDS